MTQSRLSARLRDETQSLHHLAEQSGVMRQLLQGRLDAHLYCLLLRNLHALYEGLERALDRHAASASVSPVRFPLLFRATALREDLDYLQGKDWPSLSIAETMTAYVAHLETLCEEQPGLLAAHAYVRYMGDLSGGQLLRAIVSRSYALGNGAGIAFYRFPAGVDAQNMKPQFRAALDALPRDALSEQEIIKETQTAFTRHVRLFEELASVHN